MAWAGGCQEKGKGRGRKGEGKDAAYTPRVETGAGFWFIHLPFVVFNITVVNIIFIL